MKKIDDMATRVIEFASIFLPCLWMLSYIRFSLSENYEWVKCVESYTIGIIEIPTQITIATLSVGPSFHPAYTTNATMLAVFSNIVKTPSTV